jgi:cystathionine beta-synthase
MRLADVSQVPVVSDGRVVGILDESDLLLAVHADANRFRDPVSTAMTTKLKTVPPGASIEDVFRILDAGLVALVVEDDRFLGLITRSDMLAYLRRRLK